MPEKLECEYLALVSGFEFKILWGQAGCLEFVVHIIQHFLFTEIDQLIYNIHIMSEELLMVGI